MPKTRSTKLEVRNKHECPKPEIQNGLSQGRHRFGHLNFGPLDLFRISSFEIRILRRGSETLESENLCLHRSRRRDM